MIPALLLGVVGCKKDPVKDDDNTGGGGTTSLVVTQKQRSMVANLSATWCGPCGAFGGPNFKNAAAELGMSELIPLNIQGSGTSKLLPYFRKTGVDHPDSVFILGVQGAMFTSLNIQTNANGSFSIPSFSMNNVFLGTSNVTSSMIVNNAKSYNANNAKVGVVAKKNISGNNISVDVKCKFFEDAEGEYHWVAYAIEKKVKGIQNVNGVGNVADYEHQYMVRASMQNTTGAEITEMDKQSIWGAGSFASGSIKSGSEFSKKFTLKYVNFPIDPKFQLITWDMKPENTGVAVMVWKKVGNKFEYVNGFFAE